MPEGPEVRLMAEWVATYVEGKSLIDISGNKQLINKNSITYPQTVKTVATKGKKIIFLLDSGSSIVCWLGLEGHFCLEKKVNTNIVFHFSGDFKLYYDDTRHMGGIKVCKTIEDLKACLKDVGVDVLSEQEKVTPEFFSSIIKNKRIKNKRLAEFLIDQKKISGIGNYLRAEILYNAGLSPHRTLESLTDMEIELLRISILLTIYTSYLYGGVTESLGKPNGFSCSIYGCKIDPHGNTVEKFEDKQKRTMWWCPNWQH